MARNHLCAWISRLGRLAAAATVWAVAAAGLAVSPVAATSAAPAVPSSVSASSDAPKGAEDLVANPELLADAPDAFRPKFRWWWPTDALEKNEIDAQLRAIKEAGFAGVEQTTLRNVDRWGSPQFLQSLRSAMRKADELGLTFDITLGPGWPVSSPEVSDLNKGLSSQDLGYGSVDLVGGTTYSGPVPDNPGQNASIHKRLVAVTAIRVVSPPGATPLVVDPDTALNLTSTVGDNAITWTAPTDGTWKLFGFWMRPTMQVNKLGAGGGASGSGGGTGGLVVDHLNRDAVRVALESFDARALDKVADLLRASSGDVFEDSLELSHGPVPAGQSAVFWTGDMLRNWTRLRAYPVTKLLPGLFNEVAFPQEADDRLKADYKDTVNDLLVSDHLDPIESWVADKGMTFRGQTYQGDGHLPTDARRLSAAVPKPDVESLGFGDPDTGAYFPGGAGPRKPGTGDSRAVIDRYRQVVSGAHLSGADEVSNEVGASLFGAYRTDAIDIKQFADHSLAAGVSRMILHGFAYKNYTDPAATANPWIGWCPWCASFLTFADSWNQNFPQFKALARWTDYTGRAGAMVRTGRPRVDLVVLDTEADINGTQKPDPTGTRQDDFRKSLSGAGFNWDSVSAHDLAAAGGVRNGRLLPNGPAYKALVVNDEAALPAATVERLVTLAKAGLPIVVQGAAPTRGASMRAPAAEDARVQAAVAELRTLPGVKFVEGPGGTAATVAALGVESDIAGAIVDDVVPVHRRTATGDAWFLYNNSTEPVEGTITFITTGAPSSVDLWTGEVTRLGHYAAKGSTVTVPVRIEAEDTAAMLFDRRETATSVVNTNADEVIRVGRKLIARDDAGGTRSFTLSNGKKATAKLPALPAATAFVRPWALRATTTSPAGNATTDLTLNALKDWRDIPDLKGKSGTGLYATSVELTEDWVGSDRGARLRLGNFAGAVRVWINDKAVTVSHVPVRNEVDVSGYLQPGRNTLVVELSTTLNNAMRAAALTGNTVFRNFASRPELPAGLLGPVTLVPYGQIAIPRSVKP